MVEAKRSIFADNETIRKKMARQAAGVSYADILKDLKNKTYKPVYLLMGEESYYIDKISDYVQQNVLSEEQRSFDQTILYGDQVTLKQVAELAKGFPMMGERQVLIVKEAQNLLGGKQKADDSDAEAMMYYLKNPQPQTLLVLCYKYGVMDKRKRLYGEMAKAGVVFESVAPRDYQMAGWIKDYVKERGLEIDIQSATLLAEYIGTNLSRVAQAVDKLVAALKGEDKVITPELIERNIGISKDYNIFELTKSIMQYKLDKVNRIAKYLSENQKENPIFPTISVLFNLFFNLLLVHYSTDLNNKGALAKKLGVNPFFVDDYITGTKYFNARKCIENIAILKEYDGKAKGIGATAKVEELEMEMIFRLVH